MNGSVIRLLLQRFSLRHARLAPRASCLLVGILALGVAVFVSIRLANRAAVSSFTHFTDTLTGQSDLIVQAPAGTLPESVLPELRAALGARPVHIVPVVEATAAEAFAAGEAAGFGRKTFTLLGVDLLALANLASQSNVERGYFDQAQGQEVGGRGARGDEAGAGDFWRAFAAGPQIWVSVALAPTPPKSLALVFDERVRTLPVAGVIPTAKDAPRVPANLLVLDLPHLQQITGKVGRVDRVEFLVEPGPRAPERRAELQTLLEKLGGDRWIVTTPGARRESAETMTRAFRLNLTILSLIALLVGLYLIFQALDGAVVRRRTEIAILRSLGVEERAIQLAWLAEAAVLGLLGGALGVLLGWAGAQFAVRAVGQTVNALYYATTVEAASLAPGELVLGLGLGLGASLVAGWWPARLAASTPPAQVLPRGAPPAAGGRWQRSFALGAGCVVFGVALAQLSPLRLAGGGRFPLAGYAAAFFWIFGGGLMAGWLLPLAARGARPWGVAWAPARIALSHLRRPSGRHRLSVAALHCAVGMAAGMAILVASFELTVRGWIVRSLQADLYIASAGAQNASMDNFISAAAAERLASHPAVADAARFTAYPLELDGIPTLLSGTDLGLMHARSDLPWVTPPRDPVIWQAERNAGLALVSEAFVERFGKKPGDPLRLPTPGGVRSVVIAGVFADYGNERGSILVDRTHLKAWFADARVTNVSLWLKPGVDADTVRAELVREFPGLAVFTNVKLRAEVLRIFRQTFAITYALEVIAVLVAVIGLALTLTSVLLDRREELTTLRALGFTRRELAGAAALEGGVVAAAAVAGGLVLSVALGWLLIYVINKQSFGWTLGFAVPWGQLAALAGAVVATGVVVSYFVGRWGADLPADREE
jgi:putative ABC transport system permease protein